MTEAVQNIPPVSDARPRRARRTGVRLRGAVLTLFVAILTIYILEFAIYLVRSDTADKVIKLLALIILVVAFPYQRMPRRFTVVLTLYAALFVFTALPALVKLDAIGLLQLVKVILQFTTLPLILARFARDLPPPIRLLRLPVFWGALFAVQGMTLYFLVTAGREPVPTTVYLGQLNNMPEKDFGILGYGNTHGKLPDGRGYLRPQVWFLEPSNLAGFLIFPTFMAWGLFRTARKYRYLLASILCLGGILFAFSLAGYMALGAALLSLLVIRPARRPANAPSSIRRLIGPVAIILAFLVFANYLMSRTHAISDSASGTRMYYMLGRSPVNQKLFQDYWGLDMAIRLTKSNPFGVGLGHTLGLHEWTSANAFIFWMVATGVPGVVLILVLYGCLFYWFVIPALSSKLPFARAAAAGFVGATVQGLQYGNWMQPSYLFTVAIVMLCGYYAERRAARVGKESSNARNY